MGEITRATPAYSLIGLLAIACAQATSAPRLNIAWSTIPWDQMSRRHKLSFMVQVVDLKMRKLFLDFDRHRYPRMSCSPCHRRGATPGDYRMPNPDLLLDAACSPALAQFEPDFSVPRQHHHLAKMSAMDDFMVKRVTPEMAYLLGQVPFDNKTRTGYSCFGCHTKER
jgi:hypothetical protein